MCVCMCVCVSVCVGVCVCVCQFQAKQRASTFSAQIFPKLDLGLKIQKTNIGIRINIPEILCMTIIRQNEPL